MEGDRTDLVASLAERERAYIRSVLNRHRGGELRPPRNYGFQSRP